MQNKLKPTIKPGSSTVTYEKVVRYSSPPIPRIYLPPPNLTHRPKNSYSVIWAPAKKVNKNKNNDVRDNEERANFFMSGDSSDENPKAMEVVEPKADEQSQPTVMDVEETAVITKPPVKNLKKQELKMNPDKNTKETGENPFEKDKINDDLENINDSTQTSDKVDYAMTLKPPRQLLPKNAPPHNHPEDEECGVSCLYYTVQCCDCSVV